MNRIATFLLLVVIGCCSCGARAQGSHEPLTQTQLLGLVAGAALPENIVTALQERGVSFHADAAFRAEMEKVGADPRVLAALDSAKVTAKGASNEAPNKDVLDHIVNAATMMNSKQFPEGAAELKAVLTASFSSPESGFVMAQMLRL